MKDLIIRLKSVKVTSKEVRPPTSLELQAARALEKCVEVVSGMNRALGNKHSVEDVMAKEIQRLTPLSFDEVSSVREAYCRDNANIY